MEGDLKRLGRRLGVYHGPITPNLEEMQQDLADRRARVAKLSKAMGQSKGTPATEIPPNPSPQKMDQNSEDNKLFMSLRSHYSASLVAFYKALRKFDKPLVAYPPPGCVMVSGMVEIDCQVAYVTLNVVGHWDPKTGSYNEPSIFTSVRRVQPKIQPPPGGN